jgi:chlorobactene glucosyltransferase
MLALSLAWLAAVLLLISRALRQRRLFQEVSDRRLSVGGHPKLAIIVPARNEERNIGLCIESLRAQRYPETCLSIVAVDDNSSDGTAEILKGFAAASNGLTVFRAPALPASWTGKSHACWIGAEAALADHEWLCFVDADIEAQPALIETALAFAVAEGIDFLSLTPRQTLVTFSERLILPCGLYLLSFCQDLAEINKADSPEVSATGQFILVRSAVYRAIGGHKAVRREICEDVALARLSRQQGFKTALFGGTALYSTRMYTGWNTLWPGVTKNLVEMLGGPASALLKALVAITLAWAAPLLPLIDAYRCASSGHACIALAAALPASLAAFAFHIVGSAFFRIPFWYGLIFPLGYTVGAALALDSVRRRMTGQVRWKGRVYG